jgi:hypothetical protein
LTDYYAFHDVTLRVQSERYRRPPGLQEALDDQSFVAARARSSCGAPSIALDVRFRDRPATLPARAVGLFRSHELQGVAAGHHVWLSDGASVLALDSRRHRGTARLAPEFLGRPRGCCQRFWALGLMFLLRSRGLYGLHAAAVVSPADAGVLLVGPSGCGKSTLTIGLVRRGWRYLSDDAVLLREGRDGIDAFALRKPFSVDADAANGYADLPLSPVAPGMPAARKRRLDMQSAYPERHANMCSPSTIVFPRIVPEARSTLRCLPRGKAFAQLAEHSGISFLDRPTAGAHLALLSQVLRRAAAYELCAGRDLGHSGEALADLLGGRSQES